MNKDFYRLRDVAIRNNLGVDLHNTSYIGVKKIHMYGDKFSIQHVIDNFDIKIVFVI